MHIIPGHGEPGSVITSHCTATNNRNLHPRNVPHSGFVLQVGCGVGISRARSVSRISNKPMRFKIELGQNEKHTVEYEFNQLFGRLTIKVDDKPVQQSVRLFSEPVRQDFTLNVGEFERYTVRIEKERKNLYGQVNRVFINNRLTQLFQGV